MRALRTVFKATPILSATRERGTQAGPVKDWGALLYPHRRRLDILLEHLPV